MPRAKAITGRQREILELLAAGLTDKQIAARLGISYRTVRSHIEALEEVLEVHSRAGLVGRWLGQTRAP
jgi:DNA-binding CsgD family transcriptional regulator